MNEILKSKITKALSSMFIGEVDFNSDEIDEMIIDCSKSYNSLNNRYAKYLSVDETEELLVLIINISKTWTDEGEGKFWTRLFGEIYEDGSIQPTKFYDDFEQCFNRHGLVLFRSKENKRMFRETILLHAFAPDTSSKSFIKLLWNWYSDEDTLNFNYQNNDVIFAKMAKYLQTRFSESKDMDEDVSFEGNVYQIKSSLKYLFTQDIERGIFLIDKLFFYLDAAYFSESDIKDSYIFNKCNNTLNEIINQAKIPRKGKRRKVTERVVDDYSKIHIDYELDADKQAILVLPEIRAIDEIGDIYKICFFKDDICVKEIEGYIVGEGFKRKIKRLEIPLKECLDNKDDEEIKIHIKLYIKRFGKFEEIYDSKNTLNRDFVLIKNSHEIKTEISKIGDYFVIVPYHFDISEYTNCNISYVNLFTYSLISQEQSYMVYKEKRVFFTNKNKLFSQFIPEGELTPGMYAICDNSEIPVYERFNGFSVVLDGNINLDKIVLIINKDKKIIISEIIEKDSKGYFIDLTQESSLVEGKNNIRFIDVSKNKELFTYDFYITNRKLLIISNKYSFNDRAYVIQLIKKIYEFEKINIPANVDNIHTFIDEQEFVVYNRPIGWRIDQNDWNYKCIKKFVWHENSILHNNCILEIKNDSLEKIKVFVNDEKILPVEENLYKLGDILTNNKKCKTVSVFLEINKHKYNIFNIANKESLDDFDIDIEEKTINLADYFVGKEDSNFHIILDNDEHKYEINCGMNDTFDVDIPDDEYDVQIYIKDFFGEDKLLLKDRYFIGNSDKVCFKNKTIKLDKFKNPIVGKVKLSDVYIYNVNYLRNEGEIAIYEGILSQHRKEYKIEIHKRDERVLQFYYIGNGEFKNFTYDTIKKCLSLSDPNNESYVVCGSCYYEVEE